MMVWDVAADAVRAVNLLEQQDFDQLMGESHCGEAECFIAFFNDFFRKAKWPANNKGRFFSLLVKPLQKFRERRRSEFPALFCKCDDILPWVYAL